MNGSVVTEVRRFGGRSYEKATEFLFSLDVAEQGMLLCVSDPKYVKAWKLETFKTRLTDVAEEWLHREPVRVLRDYDALTQSFLKRFPSDPEGHEEAQIEAGKLADWQQGKLTFQEYVLRTQDLARNVGPEVNRMIAVQFVSGLEDADLRRQTSSDLKAMGLRMNNPRLTLADAVGCAREAYESQSDLETLERTHARIKRKEAGFSNQTHERWQVAAESIPLYVQHPRVPGMNDMPAFSGYHSGSGSSLPSSKSGGSSSSDEIIRGLQKSMEALRIENDNLRARNVPHNPGSGWANNVTNGNGPRGPAVRFQGAPIQSGRDGKPVKCYNCYEVGHIKPECPLPPLDVQEKATRRLRAGGFDSNGEARTGGINLNKESYMVEAMRTRDVPEGNFLACLDGEDAALERGTVGKEPVSGKEVSQGELDEAVRKIRESYLIEARLTKDIPAGDFLVSPEDEDMTVGTAMVTGPFDANGKTHTSGISIDKESYMVEVRSTKDIPAGDFLVSPEDEDMTVGTAMVTGPFDANGKTHTSGISIDKESYMVEVRSTKDIPEGEFLVGPAVEDMTVGTVPVGTTFDLLGMG
ncbi:hypothetical protein YB2330_002004 [Saitoella coloradoensis]